MNYKEVTGKKNPFEGLSSDEKRRLIVYFGYIAVPSVPMDEIKRRWGAVLKDDEIPTTFEALEMVEIIKREVLAEENIEKKTSKKSGCFARLVFGLLCVATGIVIGIAAFPYVQQNLQKDWNMLPDETKETDEEIQPSSSLPVPKRVPKHGEVAELTLPGGEKIEMIYCALGTFLMGSPVSESDRNNNETQHRVTLTKGFWLSKNKVSQSEWIDVMGGNPSEEKGFDLPVAGVSWLDCSNFVAKINAKIRCGARLPTEAEWEYACREAIAKRCAFVDMQCGLMEWCNDFYGGDYSVKSVKDPQGARSNDTTSCRVLRGGDEPICGIAKAYPCNYSILKREQSRPARRLCNIPSFNKIWKVREKYHSSDYWLTKRNYPKDSETISFLIGFRLCCDIIPDMDD